VISEPVTGSSLGAMAPVPEYFPIIREICDRYGVLLIVDEVITGFGRTGKNFGIEHWRIVPDMIVTGKGISSGYTPLGATIVHERVYDIFAKAKRSSFFLGYTYGGNPLSCAAGLAVLRYIQKNALVERAARMGAHLFRRFETLKEIPIVGDIRGKGLLLGIELVQDAQKTPFPRSKKVAESIVRKAFERGLILLPGHGLQDGVVGDLLMMAPPFIIQEGEIDELYRVLSKIIEEAGREKGLA
jgi:adenosylmethionine-8-amino-7-oxononanoate aminotransferase